MKSKQSISFWGTVFANFFLAWAAWALPGENDTTFANSNLQTTVSVLLPFADGRVVAGLNNGAYTNGGTNFGSLVRLNANGTPDASFLQSDTNKYTIYGVTLLSDSNLLVSGNFTSYAGTGRKTIVKLDATGALINNFTSGVNSTAKIFTGEQPDGKIIVAGSSLRNTNNTTIPVVARLFADGTRDTNFIPAAQIASVLALDMVPDGSGRFFVGCLNGVSFKYQLARCSADGALDAGFEPVTFDSMPQAIKALPSGGAFVGGFFNSYSNSFGSNTVMHLVKVNPNGSRDTAFNFSDSRFVSVFGLQSDGKVVLPNASVASGVDRFNADGSPDAGWTRYANGNITVMAVDATDRVFTTSVTAPPPTFALLYGVYRLQTDGSYGAIAPFFTTGPSNLSVYPGDNATFVLNAAGPGPIAYQWQFNSNNIAGATNSTLPLTDCQLTNAGFYRLVAANANGSTNSANGTLSLRLEPHITQSPVPAAVDASEGANFTVIATSLFPMTYQWRFNGNLIDGATQSGFGIVAAHATNAGNYSVVVSNDYGATTSSIAALTVNSTLRFKQQPITNLFLFGGVVTNLSAVAVGNPPLAFQWFKDSAPLVSATSSALNFNPVDRTNSGDYQLVVTNSSGSITSLFASVAVFGTPVSSWIVTNALPNDPQVNPQAGQFLDWICADGPLGAAVVGNTGVARYDDDGSLRWVVPFLPSTNVLNNNTSVAVDGRGNTYVIAMFKGTVTVGGLSATNPGTLTLENPQGRASLLAKLNHRGQAQWLRYIDGSLDLARLSVDDSGAVLVSGSHTSKLIANGQIASKNDYGSAVLLRYLPDGTLHWLRDYKYFSSPGSAEINAVACAGTNIWIGGFFNATLQVGAYQATTTPAAPWYFFSRLDTNGTAYWLATHGGGAQYVRLGAGTDGVLWAAGRDGNSTFLSRFALNSSLLANTTPASSAGNASIGVLTVDTNNVGVISGQFYAATTVGTNYFYQPNSVTNFCYTGRFGTNGLGQGAAVNGSGTANITFYQFAGNRQGDAYALGYPPAQLGTTAVLGTNYFLAKFAAPVLAPTILYHPIAALTNNALQNFALTLGAQGLAPLAYQWRLNGVPIPDATNSSYQFISPMPTNSGKYDCVISNAYGTVTSLSSQVTVKPPFSFGQIPKSQLLILGGETISGSNILASLLEPGEVVGKIFNLVITNGSGMWPANASFPLRLVNTSSYNIQSGDLGTHSGTWSVVGSSPGQIGLRLFYWTTSPSNIMTTVNLYDAGHFDIHHDIADPSGCCAEGYYSISAGNLNAAFSFTLNGVSLNDPNLQIQWFRNGVLVPGQTNTILSLNNAGYDRAGFYSASVSYLGYILDTTPVPLNFYPPALGYSFVPGNTSITFSIPPGYVLQSSAALAPPTWITVSTNSSYTVPASQPGAYFRIVPP